MLQIFETFSTALFNLMSIIAVAVAGWWFIKRGKLRSLLDISSDFSVLQKRGDRKICQFALKIANVGASSVRVSQIALKVDWLSASAISSGSISSQNFSGTEFHNLLSSHFFVVPSATSITSTLLTTDAPADFCVIRWYLFYGRPVKNLRDLESLDQLLKKPCYYYYDEVLFALGDGDEKIPAERLPAQFSSFGTRRFAG